MKTQLPINKGSKVIVDGKEQFVLDIREIAGINMYYVSDESMFFSMAASSGEWVAENKVKEVKNN